jgi:competence protein ComEC
MLSAFMIGNKQAILARMKKSVLYLSIGILVMALACMAIWSAVIRENRRGLLTVSFLNIGQGDSIFIDAPSGRQVLIDGGPDSSVLRALGAVMPWYDRSIDIVIPTHPDKDHIAGLIDVLQRYDVRYLLQSSVQGSTPTWNTLESTIDFDKKRGLQVITAQRGEVIDLGSGAYLEVLSPDRLVPHVDTNTGCVVTKLVYGNTSFMLTCDMPQDVEQYLVYLDGSDLQSTVLKAGHHGSKTSSLPLFVGTVNPQYAVFSRGCNNQYGFPHPETIATMKSFNIPLEDTCKQGTVTFVSDGKTVALK